MYVFTGRFGLKHGIRDAGGFIGFGLLLAMVTLVSSGLVQMSLI
jgi:hypothetical protein